jgi:hypothetical protein
MEKLKIPTLQSDLNPTSSEVMRGILKLEFAGRRWEREEERTTSTLQYLSIYI